MFLSTRNPEHLYKFIVLSSKKNAESFLKKKLSLEILKPFKCPSFSYIIFLIYIIVSGKIFTKKRALIFYENVEIGRFILAATFKNYKTYVSKFYFYRTLLSKFINAGILLKTIEHYVINKKIKAAYVDHCGYLYGIIYSYLADKKIPVYTNNFPATIYRVDFRNSQKKIYKKYEKSLKINYRHKLSKNKINKIKKVLYNFSKTPNMILWMGKKNYKKFDKINYKKFDFVVYAHSFTDGQLWYGNDGFENTLDWLEFTLNKLSKLNKKVLIKAHPNFYEPSYGISSFWDKIIYSKVIKKFKKNKNFYFIDKPLFNFKLLNKISKNCVLVTHHGTVMFEGASFGFKTICSKATFFDKKFKVSNFWSNKSEYEKLLNLNQNRLNSSSKNDLLFLFYKTFIDDFSCFGKKVWENIIAKEVGINAKKFYAKIKVFAMMGKIQESQKYLNKVVGKKEDKIILKISKNIKIL